MYEKLRDKLHRLRTPSADIDIELSKMMHHEDVILPYTRSVDAVMALIIEHHHTELCNIIRDTISFLAKEGEWHIRFSKKEDHWRWPVAMMLCYLAYLDNKDVIAEDLGVG